MLYKKIYHISATHMNHKKKKISKENILFITSESDYNAYYKINNRIYLNSSLNRWSGMTQSVALEE